MKRRKGQLTNGNNLVKELQRQSHERKSFISFMCRRLKKENWRESE